MKTSSARLRHASRHSSSLRPGLIFEIANSAGMVIPDAGDKRVIHCPFHDDRHASAFLSAANIFYCSRCTPDGGWSAKRFASELGAPWPRSERAARAPASLKLTPRVVSFTPMEASAVWHASVARARDDQFVESDWAVYRYLAHRGLLESWELSAFGVISSDMALPSALRWWPNAGYRIIVPLFTHGGELIGVQGRAINAREPKTMVPKGSSISGAVFADARGQSLLRGQPARSVILGEGLTDTLALCISSPIPVLAAPGIGSAVAAIGPWVNGVNLYLALDTDSAGESVIEPIAASAYAQGAVNVWRVKWPAKCKDACDVVTVRGTDGLEALLARHIEATHG